MTLEEYFKYALKNGFPKKSEWIYSMFTKPLSSTEYVIVEDGKYKIKHPDGDIDVKLNDNETILDVSQKITLDSTDLKNVNSKTSTTIGRAIINFILFVHPFGSKIAYQNDEKINLNKIHQDVILTQLDIEDGITIKEYQRFGLAITYIRTLADIFIISSTEKAILPPPGIEEFKRKKIAEFKKKYGEDCFKDKIRIVELEEELKAYDREWLKDDPSYGISLSGKVLNNSRKKRYLMFGAEDGILPTEEPVLVENSLLEGYPKDKKQIASMFNTARAGSYSRGKETQESGVISDRLVRGTIGFKVDIEDCKSKYYLDLHVTKDNYISLIGRNRVVNGKVQMIKTKEDAEALIGTTIGLRDMLYCNAKGLHYCKVCAGKEISRNENAIALIALDIGAAAMTAKLKKMHDATLSIYNLKIEDLLS